MMTPPFKFRAWDTVDKRWVDPFSLTASGDIQLWNEKTLKWVTYPKERYIITQFTGLVSKGKHEIYIGDIIELIDYNYFDYTSAKTIAKKKIAIRVGWHVDELRGFLADGSLWDNGQSYEDYSHDINWSECKHLGNIYENSEKLR